MFWIFSVLEVCFKFKESVFFLETKSWLLKSCCCWWSVPFNICKCIESKQLSFTASFCLSPMSLKCVPEITLAEKPSVTFLSTLFGVIKLHWGMFWYFSHLLWVDTLLRSKTFPGVTSLDSLQKEVSLWSSSPKLKERTPDSSHKLNMGVEPEDSCLSQLTTYEQESKSGDFSAGGKVISGTRVLLTNGSLWKLFSRELDFLITGKKKRAD